MTSRRCGQAGLRRSCAGVFHCWSVRAAILVALLALSLTFAGDVTAAQHTSICYVDVYFVRSHTVVEKQRVAAALRTDPLIVSFRYVSRAQALAALRRKFPDLVNALTSNPLLDSFRAVPKPHVAAHRVIAELKAQRFRGVGNIAGHTPDGLDCGYLP
jgi:cell division protein FtsX